MPLRHLEEARRHVAEASGTLPSKDRVADLARGGHNTTMTHAITLTYVKRSLDQPLPNRRLRSEVGQNRAWQGTGLAA